MDIYGYILDIYIYIWVGIYQELSRYPPFSVSDLWLGWPQAQMYDDTMAIAKWEWTISVDLKQVVPRPANHWSSWKYTSPT